MVRAAGLAGLSLAALCGLELWRARLRSPCARPAAWALRYVLRRPPPYRESDFVRLSPEVFFMGSRAGGARHGEQRVALGAFMMARYPVTVAEYAAYLNVARPPGAQDTPQWRRRKRRYRPRAGAACQPAAHVSYDEAMAYARWTGSRWGRRVRLPTEAEWEYAARGGIADARYPWGWGAPDGRACYRATGPVAVHTYPPNAYGLYDMAGNVYEWCQPGTASVRDGEQVARGGAWAERDPAYLKVYRRTRFPPGYRDADVGFRLAVDP